MPDQATSSLPPPSPEQRRVAAGQFERANQVIAKGDFDYGIRLLLSCCHLDPSNLIYRQALRRTEKAKYNNNQRGSMLAWLTTGPVRAKIKAAKHAGDWIKVLEQGEAALVKNPWDTGVQIDMADAAEHLGLLDLAVWSVEQARQKNPNEVRTNRVLARLYERRGNFTQAMALWSLILKSNPADREAADKAKDLAASETIARGNYGGTTANQPVGRLSNPDLKLPPGSAEHIALPPNAAAQGAASAPPSVDRVAREAATIRARIDADPTNANAYLQLAGLYRRADQLDQARQTLEQALGPTGNHFDVANELLDLQIEPFRRDLELTEQKLRSDPKDEELRSVRSRLSKEVNSRELELYRRKADRYPTDMAARFEFGVRLSRAGQIDEAIRELQTTRADPRHQWRSLVYLGHCFKHRNNWRLARRNFEEALQALPASETATRKEVLFQLAHGCADAGDLSAAVDLGHELANLDFTYRDIGRLLDEWQSRLQANV